MIDVESLLDQLPLVHFSPLVGLQVIMRDAWSDRHRNEPNLSEQKDPKNVPRVGGLTSWLESPILQEIW